MAKHQQGWLTRIWQAATVRRWARAAASVEAMPPALLRSWKDAALQLRAPLDRVIHGVDNQLAGTAIGSRDFPLPIDSDWAWRPELWSGLLAKPGLVGADSHASLGDEITLFHDCPHAEMALRQLRNKRESDRAAFAFRLDVFRFAGSYLSLAIDLPLQAAAGLRRKHLIEVNAIAQMDQPREIFARLNIKHGPNVEQIVRSLNTLQQEVINIEFDLAYTKLNEKRVEKLWLDLIFEAPALNQVTLRDLTFNRRRRAEF